MMNVSKTEKKLVGVPKAEAYLHTLVSEQADRIIQSGRGRSLFILREAEIGNGRPDVIIFSANSSSLRAFLKENLRISTLNSLKATYTLGSLSSPRWEEILRQELYAAGWTMSKMRQFSEIIEYSIAIEAKISDWKSGVRQAARYRAVCGNAAILLPEKAIPRVRKESLDIYQLGLISESQEQVNWVCTPPTQRASEVNRLWLLEQFLRGLETKRAYMFSRSAKVCNASYKFLI